MPRKPSCSEMVACVCNMAKAKMLVGCCFLPLIVVLLSWLVTTILVEYAGLVAALVLRTGCRLMYTDRAGSQSFVYYNITVSTNAYTCWSFGLTFTVAASLVLLIALLLTITLCSVCRRKGKTEALPESGSEEFDNL